jgi:hypothetical protein
MHRTWEQLWCKQTGENTFVVCCVPFCLYDLALGDEVETSPPGFREYEFRRVLRPSGRRVYRVILPSCAPLGSDEDILQYLRENGYLWEHYSWRVIAIDADSCESAARLEAYLSEGELRGRWEYEQGFST